MSLRAFHLFFVSVSVLLCGLVTVWGVDRYRQYGALGALALAAACVVVGLGLIYYGLRVYRKFQELGR